MNRPAGDTLPRDYEELKEAIAARYPGLSRQLQKIARFALEYPQDVALETVASLAARAEVQPSSMVRFAQALGYEGFSGMQQVFRTHLVAGGGSYRERIEQLRHQGRSASGDPAGVLADFVDEGITALEQLREHVSFAALSEAVDLLRAARDIYLLAERRAFPVAFYLYYALRRLETRAHLVDGVGGTLAQQVGTATHEDVVLAVSFPPYSPDVAAAFAEAHQRGAATLAITDSPVSPLGLEARLALAVRQQEEGAFRSLVAPMCLAQSLVVALGYRMAADRNGEPQG